MKAFSSTLLVFILCSLPAVSGRNVFQSLLDGFQKHKDGHHHLGNDRSAPSEDQRRRLLETGRKSTNVDLDAATGTVSHIVTPEEKAQKEKAKEAQTCDAQMALALVQANEKQEAAEKERDAALKEHAAAIDKIVNLQTLLTQLEGKLAVAATDLKETKETADRVLKETKQQAKEELENTQQKAQQDINAVKEGKAQALQQEKEQHRVELDNLKTEKDDIIVSLQKKLKMTSEELQRTLEEELEKARTDRDEKLAKLQTKMDAAVAELEADRDSKVAAAESDRDTKIANLKKKMETESRDATKLLQTTKDEAKAYMVTQVNAVKAELAQAKADHEKTLNEKNQKIKTLQQHAERVLEKKSSLEEELNAAREELDHWRTLHASRSYCNMTHISTDLYDSSAYALQRSVDLGKVFFTESKKHAQRGAKEANKAIKQQVEKHWPTIKPHYDEHIVGNYHNHIKPRLQEHVYPRMDQLSKWYKNEVEPRLKQGVKDFQKGYQRLVEFYGKECLSSLKAYEKASKENDFLKEHPLPKSAIHTWTHSCSHPEETMESAVYGLLLLAGIIFHRRILGTVWWMLNLVLTILVTFTPLRFFISRRKSQVKQRLSSVKREKDEGPPVPDITISSSKSPNAPFKNTRTAKKATMMGPM